jgi:hypothetical protein
MAGKRWATVAVIAVLALIVGDGTAALVLRDSTDASADSASAAAPTPSATAARIRVVAPETLGDRKRIWGGDWNTAVDDLVNLQRSVVPGARGLVAAFYTASGELDILTVSAVAVDVRSPESELDAYLNAVVPGSTMILNLVEVEPGPLGGVAKCGDIGTPDGPSGMCAWASSGSIGAITVRWVSAARLQKDFARLRGGIELAA